MNILKRLENRCCNQGDKDCLSDGIHTLNYSELWRLSGQVYAFIKNKGIGKEQVVMISMDRNVYALVCIVGVLRSNAAFVVMGQDYPEERKEYIKKDSGCVLEITEDLFKEILQTEGIDGYEDRQPHDLAYMVHTSGTTGNPKCVMHEFGGLENCRAIGRSSEENIFSETNRMGMTSPMNFVACIYQLFYALNCGATFVLVPKQVTNNLNIFKKFLTDNNITDVFMTPSLLKIMGKFPPVVKRAFIYGEAAKDIYIDEMTVYNIYGQSETGSYFTFFKIDRLYDYTPIGIPCNYTAELMLLDENCVPVTEGQEGELCTDLPYFRGYKNLPEQSAKALAGGVYHTGDVARMDEEGRLVLLHRKDTMVKINGNRVELTEIENRMKKITGGLWNAVNVCKNGDKAYLCAYYVDDLPFSVDELKRQMAESLANYMLPSFFIKLDRIPLNDNGKFSRRLLPEPDFSTLRKEYKAPVNDMQKRITAVFSKVLGLEQVGIDEDFFELGGDSLSAIQAIGELNIQNLLTSDIYTLRNTEALSEKCLELMSESVDAVSSVQPLAGTQNFMRIYHEKLAESTAYNISSLYRLKKGVDVFRLKTSISKVMHSHQAFRTIIRKTGDGIFLVLGEEIREPEIIDTTEKELQSMVERLVMPYNLYDNLLYKCLIIRTEANAYLLFEMHHIITDGTSMQVVLKEIGDSFNSVDIKEDQYFRLIQNRVKAQDAAQYRIDRNYYLEKMPSKERSFMPQFDFIYPDNVPGISSVNLKLSEQDLLKVKDRYRLSPTDFFIMCYLIALSKMTGNNKVGTAFTVNGRDSAMAQNIVGLLIGSYYVNLDIDKNDSIDDIARKMRCEFDEIQKHRGFDITSLVTETNGDEMACSNILYQDKLRDMTENIKDLVEDEIELPNPYYKASYYWEFEIVNNGDNMDIVLYYNASRFSKETAARMLDTYREVCSAVLAHQK